MSSTITSIPSRSTVHAEDIRTKYISVTFQKAPSAENFVQPNNVHRYLNQRVIRNINNPYLRNSIIPVEIPDPLLDVDASGPDDKPESFEQLAPKLDEIMRIYKVKIEQEKLNIVEKFWKRVKKDLPTHDDMTPEERDADHVKSIYQQAHQESRLELDRLYAERDAKIHEAIQLPESQRADIRLRYSDDSRREPYQFQKLNTIIRGFIKDVLVEVEKTGYSIDIQHAIEWLKWVDSTGDRLQLTSDIKTTRNLLTIVEFLMKKFPETSEVGRNLKVVRNGLCTIRNWLEATPSEQQQILQMSKEHKNALDFVRSVTSRGVMPSLEIAVSNLPYNSSASYNGDAINIDGQHFQNFQKNAAKAETWAVVHEIAHCIEISNQEILTESVCYRETRSRPGKGVRDGILEGDWEERGGTSYSGKVYRDHRGKDISTEVPSTGLARLYDSPGEFYENDRDNFKYLINAFRGYFNQCPTRYRA